MVNNGQALIHWLADHKQPDIILMDCEMPEMDGFTATSKIRQHEENKKGEPIPIIAMTAHAVDEYRQRCFECGMNDYLAKPIKLMTLSRLLHKWAQ